MAETFSLGLSYWPRRKAHGFWRAFDRSELREEFEHIATLGVDTLRLCLRWEDVQPQANRVDSGVMSAFEHALDLAQSNGMRVVAALFSATLDGGLSVPGWVNQPDVLGELRRSLRFGPQHTVPSAAPPLIYEQGYHANQTRDLFSDPAIRQAQRYLLREVLGYFATHPALWAWQLGEGLEYVRRPEANDAVRDWYAAMQEAVGEHAPQARLLGSLSARALSSRPGPRPEYILESFALLGVAAEPPLQLSKLPPIHSAYVAYIYALTAALAGRPAIVTSLALPTAPRERVGWANDNLYGRAAHSYLAEPEQQAQFAQVALERLRELGARGAWLSSYADYPDDLWRRPPLDRTVRARTQGVVDALGREKPIADVLRAFAAARHPVAEAKPAIEVDPERYWRDPRHAFATAWQTFAAEEAER